MSSFIDRSYSSSLNICIESLLWIIAIKIFAFLTLVTFWTTVWSSLNFFSIVVLKLISVQTTTFTLCSRIFTLSSILMHWKNSWSFMSRISFILILWKYEQKVLITASRSVSLFILLSLTLIILWSIRRSNSWSRFED